MIMTGGTTLPIPATPASERWQLRITFQQGFQVFIVVNLVFLVLVLLCSLFLESQVETVHRDDYQNGELDVQIPTIDIDSLYSDPRCDFNTFDVSVNSKSKFYSTWNSRTVSRSVGRDQKVIVIWTRWWGVRLWGVQDHYCPSMPECVFTGDREQVGNADALVFHYHDTPKVYSKAAMPLTRLPHQRWVWFAMECPIVTRLRDLVSYSGVFNWTMTYRNDSDVLTAYGSSSLIYKMLKGKKTNPNKDYTLGKKHLAVWFVSNCYKYLPRFTYAEELVKHIHVDVFGQCGEAVCSKKDFECSNHIIKQYKFYLSFESYKCQEYITEKFWRNAIENEVVPVVFGAPKADYKRYAPPGSFIHVDDFESPKALADYLKILDKDKEKYNQYFRWRTHPPKSAVPEDYGRWCNLCRKLQQVCPTERKVYTDLEGWWKGEDNDVCEPVVLKDHSKDPMYAIYF
ncbi:FUT5 [Branchiostoma lanceolatum]|uniref:Fucosyltransferase n=1 Tax=Branchiostoma lanceolatum TaxID=7740 RepID=A0A8J9W112_BRALA|nr:FUT5 [Branchiostoma lanceolatum]